MLSACVHHSITRVLLERYFYIILISPDVLLNSFFINPCAITLPGIGLIVYIIIILPTFPSQSCPLLLSLVTGAFNPMAAQLGGDEGYVHGQCALRIYFSMRFMKSILLEHEIYRIFAFAWNENVDCHSFTSFVPGL